MRSYLRALRADAQLMGRADEVTSRVDAWRAYVSGGHVGTQDLGRGRLKLAHALHVNALVRQQVQPGADVTGLYREAAENLAKIDVDHKLFWGYEPLFIDTVRRLTVRCLLGSGQMDEAAVAMEQFLAKYRQVLDVPADLVGDTRQLWDSVAAVRSLPETGAEIMGGRTAREILGD